MKKHLIVVILWSVFPLFLACSGGGSKNNALGPLDNSGSVFPNAVSAGPASSFDSSASGSGSGSDNGSHVLQDPGQLAQILAGLGPISSGASGPPQLSPAAADLLSEFFSSHEPILSSGACGGTILPLQDGQTVYLYVGNDHRIYTRVEHKDGSSTDLYGIPAVKCNDGSCTNHAGPLFNSITGLWYTNAASPQPDFILLLFGLSTDGLVFTNVMSQDKVHYGTWSGWYQIPARPCADGTCLNSNGIRGNPAATLLACQGKGGALTLVMPEATTNAPYYNHMFDGSDGKSYGAWTGWLPVP